MGLFQYTAIEADGRKQKGIIDADSLQVAKERLLKERILVVALAPYKERKHKISYLKEGEVLEFTRDLAALLKAGLPLYESLVTIEEKYKRHRAHALLLDLCDRVKQGSSLSSVLKDHPKSFNTLYISMVSAGEESGSLESVFEELGLLIAKSQKLKKQILSALIYPAFLGSFCLLVLAGLFFFLIPSMQELYEGRTLHPMTTAILNLSLFLQKNSLSLALSLTLSTLGALFFLRRPYGKRLIQHAFLRLPLIKRLVTQSVLVRFCRALSVLLTSGVPYLRALSLARKVMHHAIFEEVIERAEKEIVQGKKISEELSRSSLIPPLVSRMLAMAEETGSSATMLGSIADIYEEDLEKSLTRFVALLQPVILLILGVIVGVILLSVLLPLTDVSSFVM